MYKYYEHDIVHLGTMICSLWVECDLIEEVATEKGLDKWAGDGSVDTGNIERYNEDWNCITNLAHQPGYKSTTHFQWTFCSTSLDSADWPPSSHLMT